MCTALQIALVDLLFSWNIKPDAVIGHSSGEIAAAYCVYGLSSESALKIAYYRGVFATKLSENTSVQGAMLFVGMSEPDVEPYIQQVAQSIGGTMVIGCINSPNSVTLSGDHSCIEALDKLVTGNGIFTRKLKVNVAYHSPHMAQISREYGEAIRNISPRIKSFDEDDSVHCPIMFSSVSGARIKLAELSSATYWIKNLTSKVEFSQAVERIADHLVARRESRSGVRTNKCIFMEIGPSSALRRPIRDIVSKITPADTIIYDSVLEKDLSATVCCLQAIGRLYMSGYPIDFTQLNHLSVNGEPSTLIDLPQYCFDHSHVFWQESRISKNFRFRKYPRHELLGSPVIDWNPLKPRWRNIIKIAENPWIQDHKVRNWPGVEQ